MLIIAFFVMLGGKGAVVGLLLVLVRVPLVPFWISFCSCFSTLQGLLVRCLLGLFSLGTALLGLLVGFPLGGCQFLVMLGYCAEDHG